jgi:hypothetical protein
MPGIYKPTNFIDRPVLTDRCSFNNATTGTGSHIAMFNHTFLRSASDIVLVYTNPSAVTITQQAWIDVGSGPVQLTFAGASSITMGPYSVVKTDAYPFASTAGNQCKSYTATQSSGTFATTIATEPSLGDSSVSNGSTTPLTPSAISGTTNAYMRGPTAILGITATCMEPTIISVGTSISQGYGGQYDGCYGFLRAAFEPFAQMGGAGCIVCSVPGGLISTYTPMLAGMLPTLFSGCHFLYDELGANDIGFYSEAGFLAALSPIHGVAKLAGLKLARQVLSPRTDNSGTLAVDTAWRQTVNPWLRGGLLDADLVIEWNSVVETGTDTNVWSNFAYNSTDSASSVHLSTAGAAAVATYLTNTYLVPGKFKVDYREWTAAQSTTRVSSLSQGNFAA